MSTVTRSLTYEEWLQMPPVEDGRDEVVKGELRYMPPNHYPHAEIIQLLIEAILPQIDSRRVRILGSDFGLLISRDPLTCRSPDLAVYQRDRIVIKDGLYLAPPDLIVEIDIFSPSSRRIDIYKQLGVPEIWRYTGGSVQIYRLQDGEYVPSDRSPSFPLVSAIVINQFLQQAETQDDTTFIRTWRQWVRQQVSSEPA